MAQPKTLAKEQGGFRENNITFEIDKEKRRDGVVATIIVIILFILILWFVLWLLGHGGVMLGLLLIINCPLFLFIIGTEVWSGVRRVLGVLASLGTGAFCFLIGHSWFNRYMLWMLGDRPESGVMVRGWAFTKEYLLNQYLTSVVVSRWLAMSTGVLIASLGTIFSIKVKTGQALISNKKK